MFLTDEVEVDVEICDFLLLVKAYLLFWMQLWWVNEVLRMSGGGEGGVSD